MTDKECVRVVHEDLSFMKTEIHFDLAGGVTVKKRVNENKLYYELLLDYEEYEDEYDGSGAKIRFYRDGNMEFEGFLSDEFGYLKLMHKEIGKFVVYCGFLYDSENLIEYADDKWEELLSSK